jgi:ATP-binding cassette subfamily B protein
MPRQIGRLMASVNYMTQVLFAVTMGFVSNILNTAVRAMASSEPSARRFVREARAGAARPR